MTNVSPPGSCLTCDCATPNVDRPNWLECRRVAPRAKRRFNETAYPLDVPSDYWCFDWVPQGTALLTGRALADEVIGVALSDTVLTLTPSNALFSIEVLGISVSAPATLPGAIVIESGGQSYSIPIENDLLTEWSNTFTGLTNTVVTITAPAVALAGTKVSALYKEVIRPD